MRTLVSHRPASAHSVVDKIQPSAADARDGADSAANGVSDIVVAAGRMVDAVAAGA
jgi:hypothetical protein